MTTEERVDTLTKNIYDSFGSGTGYLFGIPPELKSATKTIIREIVKAEERRVQGLIKQYIERVDRKVVLYPDMKECLCCKKDFNDQNNRDKLFSKTVLKELLKEMGLEE